jgi:hypothetical protein
MFSRIALAALVMVAISAEVQAQQPIRGQVVTNRVVVNNTYNSGGWNGGYRGGWNNGVGMWPGSGPYDSAIAVAGIAAGASVINNIINSATVSRQPQVIVNQAPMPVVVQAPVQQIQGVYTIPGTVYSSGPGCVVAPTGMSTEGVPVYQRYCR